MKVVVLCGGTSTERNVSINSGTLICKALNKKGYDTILLDVYLGISLKGKNVEDAFKLGLDGLNGIEISKDVPDIEKVRSLRENPDEFFGPNVLDICKAADIVFIALHGENGENGKVQAAFDLLNIKYTGTGYEGSMLGMSKDLTRKVLLACGIKMADGFTITKNEEFEDVKQKLFVPAVVKPANGGSSVGVSIVQSMEELEKAINTAKQFDDTIVIEEYVKGREFSVGILNGTALPIIEIIPKQGFYDYKNKYVAGLTEEICPADLDLVTTSRMQEIAVKAYGILDLKVYSRIDFILSNTGEIYLLEANTLPGMTNTSLLPQEAKAVGIGYEDLCDKIIKLSLNKE